MFSVSDGSVDLCRQQGVIEAVQSLFVFGVGRPVGREVCGCSFFFQLRSVLFV